MHFEKLGSTARRLLTESDSVGGSATSSPVEVLIRVKHEPTEQQREQLTTAGARVRTVTGDVLTASTTAADIEQLTELDYVIYVELAEPLFPESGA